MAERLKMELHPVLSFPDVSLRCHLQLKPLLLDPFCPCPIAHKKLIDVIGLKKVHQQKTTMAPANQILGQRLRTYTAHCFWFRKLPSVITLYQTEYEQENSQLHYSI